MARYYRHPVTGCAALLLCFLLLPPAQWADPGENNLQGLFNWAKKSYMEGKYRETAGKLEMLLTYTGKEDRELIAKIHLLWGAANEKMGRFVDAGKNYIKAKKMAGKGPAIKDVDFSDLVEYQRIILGNTRPLKKQVIEKEARGPKKKTMSPLLVLAGFAVTAGLVALLLLTGK